MKILAMHTDIIERAGILSPDAMLSECCDSSGFEGFIVCDESAPGTPKVFAAPGSIGAFEYIIVEGMAAESQLDRLKNCCSKYPILAMALDGRGFHGQHNRPWMTGVGNLYLSMYLPSLDSGHIGIEDVVPDHCQIGDYLSESQVIALYESSNVYTKLQMMPCMAVYRTLKKLGVIPVVRYPNDIVVNINNLPHKIAGCLTDVSVRGDAIQSVRFGIGLNVEFAPDVDGNGLDATCVCKFAPDATVGVCCRMLCNELAACGA